MSSASEAMETLTAQWYNAVAAQLKLDTQQFQMVQGNIALGNTSAGMWAMMDSIPPDSITQYWTPQGYKSFSSQYGLVLTRLHDPSTASFEAKMGEYFPEWMTYLEKATIPQGTTLPAFFRAWALTHMAPDLAQACYSLLANALDGPVGEGAAAWAEAGGSRGVKAYNQSISTVEHTVSGAPSASVSLDSATESSDTSTTWAKGSTGGFFDIFFGEAGASYEKSTVVVSEAGVVVSVQFAHMTGIPIMPLSQGTIVSGPNTYQAWYVPAALSLAYTTNNYDVWDTGSPGWTSFFGENGSLQRAATQSAARRRHHRERHFTPGDRRGVAGGTRNVLRGRILPVLRHRGSRRLENRPAVQRRRADHRDRQLRRRQSTGARRAAEADRQSARRGAGQRDAARESRERRRHAAAVRALRDGGPGRRRGGARRRRVRGLVGDGADGVESAWRETRHRAV